MQQRSISFSLYNFKIDHKIGEDDRAIFAGQEFCLIFCSEVQEELK